MAAGFPEQVSISQGLGLDPGTVSLLSCSVGQVVTPLRFKGRALTSPLDGKSMEEFGGHAFKLLEPMRHGGISGKGIFFPKET